MTQPYDPRHGYPGSVPQQPTQPGYPPQTGGYSTPPGGTSYQGSGYYTTPTPTPPGGGAPHPPEPKVARFRTAVVLGVIAAVLFAGTGTAVLLWISERNDRSAVLSEQADRDATLSDLNDQVGATDSERRDAEKRRDDLQTENRTLNTCVDAVKKYLEQLRASAERNASLDKVFEVCA